MNLSAPHWLWALCLLPLLWWLSQPPRPRRVLWSAHFAQWQAALQKLRRRPARGSWPRFLLLALAFAFAAMAAARPTLPGDAGARRLVVLLDASASMAASAAGAASNAPTGAAWSPPTGAVRSAFERARDVLAAGLAALPPATEVTVLRCGGPLLRRHGSSARALQDLGAPTGPLGADLVALATSVAAEPGTAVWTLTDGQGQVALPTEGALTVFDTRGPNAAVLAVRLEDRWPLPTLGVEVDVVAFGGAAGNHVADPLAASLTVAGAVAPCAPRALSLRPGERVSVALALERLPAGGDLIVGVDLPGDRLAADDRRTFALPALPAPRIAVLAEQAAGPFAQAAAQALAGEVGGEVVAADTGAEVGMLLVDGGMVALRPGQMRAVSFGCRSPTIAEPDEWLAPSALDWRRDLPLLQGLDLSELRVDRAVRGVLPPGEPLLWADDDGVRTPLAVLAPGPVASLHFAFRLQDGNLPLLAAFPQLLRRAFVGLYGEAAQVRGGETDPAPGEVDLGHAASAPDRPLPPFASPPRELAPWCVLAGLLVLALRAFVR